MSPSIQSLSFIFFIFLHYDRIKKNGPRLIFVGVISLSDVKFLHSHLMS